MGPQKPSICSTWRTSTSPSRSEEYIQTSAKSQSKLPEAVSLDNPLQADSPASDPSDSPDSPPRFSPSFNKSSFPVVSVKGVRRFNFLADHKFLHHLTNPTCIIHICINRFKNSQKKIRNFKQKISSRITSKNNKVRTKVLRPQNSECRRMLFNW